MRGRAELSVATLPLAMSLGGVAPIVLAPYAVTTLGGWLVLIFTAYSGTRFAMTLFASPARPVSVFAWFYFYVFLGIAPLVQLSSNTWALPMTPLNDSYVTSTAIIVFLFVVAWDIAGIVVQQRKTSVAYPPRRFEVSTQRIVVLAALAILVAAYEVHQIGGVSQLFTSRLQRSTSLQSLSTASKGIANALLVYPVFVCAYVLLASRRFRRARSLRILTLFMTVAALVLANPESNSRYSVATVYIGLAFAWVWPLTKKQMVTVGLGAMVGLFIVFPALNRFRTNAHTTPVIGGVSAQLERGDYDSFEQIANTQKYVAAHGHTFGAQELSSLLFFVPRTVWSTKASDTGVMVGQYMGYSFTNLSAPAPAEAYIDGGVIWVVVVGAIVGGGSTWLDKRAADPNNRITYVGLFTPIFAVYQVIMLRGSLLQSMGGIAAISGALLLCIHRKTASTTVVRQPADSVPV